MDAAQKAARGRARGRARSVQSVPPEGAPDSPPTVQVFGEPQAAGRRLSGGSGSGDSSNGANGRGSANGNGSGSNGNGHGSNGNSSNGSPRGGSPRGMTPRPLDQAAMDRAKNVDYVPSRPSPDFVKQGIRQHATRPIPVIISNYFQFKTHPDFKFLQYSVQVKPQVDETKLLRRLMYVQKDNFRCSYLLTGLMMFVTRELPPDSLLFHSTVEDTNYEVTLTFVRDVEGSENTVFQFFNSVVRKMQQMMEFKLLGRHFFDPVANTKFPIWKLELWPGFQNSIRQQEHALMLNVDGVWKVLQTKSVLDIIQNIRLQQRENVNEACSNAICGMMVITRYHKDYKGTRAYKITRIDFGATPMDQFETKRGKITYAEYYKERYGVQITDMKQPMLVSEPKIQDVRRGQTGDIYLVPELCFPCGLTDEIRSNFKTMKDLAVCLHQMPDERVNQMQKFVNRILQSDDIKLMIKNWGLKLNPEPVEAPGRYLNTEDIVLGNNAKTKPDDKADWTNAFRGSYRMLGSPRLSKWVIIVGPRDRASTGNLVQTMKKVAGPLGYVISDPEIIPVGNIRDYPKGISDAICKTPDLDLVFIVLPSNNADNYAAVKKRCSVEYGIPSQCFLAKNLASKGLMSIATKLVIQMSAKQGGEPWGIVNPLKNILVIGFDVHHAGPGGGSSISAMCATINPTLGKYFSYIQKTPMARQEIAEQFAKMFLKCVEAWKHINGCLPERIMVYRDGVGEGQLWDVFNVEVGAVKGKIAEAYGEQPLPKLSYVVVNKRLNTRFFQKANKGYTNPLPGLVVDDVVTRPERYDFFLISQTARQGCVGPTYYNVMMDESGLTPDKLQMYTYKLCHLYYNWSGTVAVPGPCQYAHKLALQTGTALKRPANAKLSYLLHFL